jgi:hypothetical protein
MKTNLLIALSIFIPLCGGCRRAANGPEEEWVTFSPPGSGFSVLMPSGVKDILPTSAGQSDKDSLRLDKKGG